MESTIINDIAVLQDSQKKKKIMVKFDQSLSVIRKLLRKCKATREWVLYEDYILKRR